jgi:hypothetical protein
MGGVGIVVGVCLTQIGTVYFLGVPNLRNQPGFAMQISARRLSVSRNRAMCDPFSSDGCLRADFEREPIWMIADQFAVVPAQNVPVAFGHVLIAPSLG